MNNGIIIAIGGSENVGDNTILSEVIKNSKFKKNSKIIIIPTASSYQDDVDVKYKTAFGKLGCKYIKTLFISSKDQVDSIDNLNLLKESNILMFSGGDQSRISECFIGTKFLEILINKFNSDHFVVAGTSAGAMCLSNNMITGGNKIVKCGVGLSLIPELIIDTHFTERNRLSRLSNAISIYTNRIGVGLSEDTGIIIKNNEIEVIGTSSVTVFNFEELKELKFKVLYSGDKSILKNNI